MINDIECEFFVNFNYNEFYELVLQKEIFSLDRGEELKNKNFHRQIFKMRITCLLILNNLEYILNEYLEFLEESVILYLYFLYNETRCFKEMLSEITD